eukprot:TRINITY_DN2475_c0_g2_i1.p1 TRINITY_DN2475_c0_g2~~TRINITY_DN2475_c0_g2_i1.p1  ORF type:complete len:121 (-),score=27.07 TRINITY_DN2475_c0_g2_i1:141-503(-)
MSENPKEKPLNTVFLCSKCRAPLFSDQHLYEHEKGEGLKTKNQKKNYETDNEIVCNSYFITEELYWIDYTEQFGNLHCPKCNVRVGDFAWGGMHCSCGTWVMPAFKVKKKSVLPMSYEKN